MEPVPGRPCQSLLPSFPYSSTGPWVESDSLFRLRYKLISRMQFTNVILLSISFLQAPNSFPRYMGLTSTYVSDLSRVTIILVITEFLGGLHFLAGWEHLMIPVPWAVSIVRYTHSVRKALSDKARTRRPLHSSGLAYDTVGVNEPAPSAWIPK